MGRHRTLAITAAILSLLFTSQPAIAGPGVVSGAYWTATVTGDFNALVVADLNHDGWVEILGGTDEGQVILWTAGGQRIWEFQVETDWVTGISTADLDGDGSDEVLVIAAGILPTSYLYVLRTDGSLWWSHAIRDDLWTALPYNLDNDPDQELLLAARRPIALDINGDEIPDWPVVDMLRTPHVRLVDWGGDDDQDIVTLTPDSLNILKAEGIVSSIPIVLPGDIKAVEASDMDGDGTVELLALTDPALILLGNDGGIRWTWPLRGEPGDFRLIGNPRDTEQGAWIFLSDSSRIVALDENGREQWNFDAGLPGGQTFILAAHKNLLLAATTTGQAYLLDGEGRQLAEYDLDGPVSFAQMSDLNGDDHLEVLLATAGTLNVYGKPAGTSEIRARWSYAARAPIVFLESGDMDGDSRAEILLGERNGLVTMLDRRGELVWQHVHEESPSGWAQDASGNLLTWAGESFHLHDDQGAILWENQVSGTIRTIIPIFDGLATLTDDGHVTLHTLEDGSPIWTVDLGSKARDLVATESGILVAKESTILLVDRYGEPRWETKLNNSIQGVSPSPGGGIAVRSPGHLSWLDADGVILWDWETQPAERITAIEISHNLIAVGTDARILALNWQGVEVWSQPTEEVVSAIAVVNVDTDGIDEITIGTVKGSVALLSSEGDEIWREKGRERVNVLATADINADRLSEILAGFEDGVVTAYGLTLDQPPWLGEPVVTAVGDGYQYAVQARDPEGNSVEVMLEIWDPSAEVWQSLGSATAPTGEGILTWNVPNPFDTWDARKDSAFRFIWEDSEGTGRTAFSAGPLQIPVDPWYVTYSRVAGLVLLILTAPVLLTVIIRRTRTHRRSPLGQAEAALLRLRLDPDGTLLEFHQLLSDAPHALLLLEHMPGLAREAGETALGDLLEGSHLAMTHPEVMPEALRTITDALGQLEKLPMADDWGLCYTLLLEALTVTSISQVVHLRTRLEKAGEILRIKEAYLLPAAAGLDRLASAARTLHASEQVDITGDRITYLAEAFADLSEFERDLNAEPVNLESQAMIAVIHLWLGLISETLEKLRGRAEIDLKLLTRQLVLRKEVILGFSLTNSGRSPATDLMIEMNAGEGLIPMSEPTKIGILSPGANRQLELAARTSSEAGSFEVMFQIRWDDREQAGKEVTFTEHVRLIPKPRQFEPIPNPYATGRPLVPGSPVFVGREDIFNFVRENTAGGHIIVLVGQRRMGKTSLLRQLSGQMDDAWVVAYLDVQGLGLESGLEHWLADAAMEISRAAGQPTSPTPAELGPQPGPIFQSYLHQVTSGLDKGCRLLLLFDEFEEIEARVREGHLPISIFPYLRHIMQFGEASFLLAGTKRLERLSSEYWTPLFNIGLYREVGPLDNASARKLILAPVEGRLLYDELAVEKLMRLSGRQPYFLQLLCHSVVALCNRKSIPYATPEEVRQAEEEASMLGQAHLRFLWEGTSAEGQAVLTAMAWLISRGEPGTAEALATMLISLGHRLEDTHLQATLVQLINLGLVDESTDGSYRFTADMVRLWIRGKMRLNQRVS